MFHGFVLERVSLLAIFRYTVLRVPLKPRACWLGDLLF